MFSLCAYEQVFFPQVNTKLETMNFVTSLMMFVF